MRILIAIATCEKNTWRIDILKRTWIPCVPNGVEVRFFTGSDLNVPDDYRSLPIKVRAMFAWAVKNSYDRILKVDDDILVLPERLFATMTKHDYVGRVRPASREFGGPELYGDQEKPYCSGFAYWVSKYAADIISNTPDNGDHAEDRFAGQALWQAGVQPILDNRFLIWPPINGHMCTYPNEKCPPCRQEFAQASVLCPHQREDAIEPLWNYYRTAGFIPTHLPKL